MLAVECATKDRYVLKKKRKRYCFLGPSFTVDSACSSTLLALEMAYKAIRSGECESALVGGCHVCLHPALLLHLLKVGALNPNGESRVFDEKGRMNFYLLTMGFNCPYT